MTDAAASLLHSQQFDPYGTVFAQTGTAQMPFEFTGEQKDGTGLLNLRARYLNPTFGSFVSLDPLSLEDDIAGLNPYAYVQGNPLNGAVGESSGWMNRYSYVNGNPVNFADPSGMVAERPEPFSGCVSPQQTTQCPPTPTLIPSLTPTGTATLTPTPTPALPAYPSPSLTPTLGPGQVSLAQIRAIAYQLERYAQTMNNVLPIVDNTLSNGWSGDTTIGEGGCDAFNCDKAWYGKTTSILPTTPYLLGAWVRSWNKEDQVASGLTDHNCKQNNIAICLECSEVNAVATNQYRARGVTLHFRQVAPACPLEMYFSGGWGIEPKEDEPKPNDYCGGAVGCRSLQFFTGFPLTANNTKPYITDLFVQQ